MNLLLVEPREVDGGGLVRLADRRAEHLRRVLQVEVGRQLHAGVVGGAIGRATVVAVEGGEVVVRLAPGERTPPPPAIDLIVALPRPAVLHRVLQHAAAFGVGRLDLVNAWRVERSFFASPAVTPPAIRRHLLLGAEQGGTTRLPEVSVHPRLVPFLERLDEAEPAPCRLLAEPRAEGSIEDAFPHPAPRRVELAIGPEGGWIDREVTSFVERGFTPMRLGPWVVRTEVALAAAVAQVELLRRRGGAGGGETPC